MMGNGGECQDINFISDFERDTNFQHIGPNLYQYRYTQGICTYILQTDWGECPTAPLFGVDLIMDQTMLPEEKERLIAKANKEYEIWLGCTMAYNLYNLLRPSASEIIAVQAMKGVIMKIEKVKLPNRVRHHLRGGHEIDKQLLKWSKHSSMASTDDDDEPAIFIEGKAQRANIYAPRVTESAQIVEALTEICQYLNSWLNLL